MNDDAHNKRTSRTKFFLLGAFSMFVTLAVLIVLHNILDPLCGLTQEDVARSELRSLQQGVLAYKGKHGEWPPEGSACFDALKEMSDHDFNTKDPWGHPYHAQRLGFNLFELRSAGPDGQLATPDDVAIVCKAESTSD